MMRAGALGGWLGGDLRRWKHAGRNAPVESYDLFEESSLSDIWYYADYKGQVGPLTLQELRETLPRFSEPENVLVWRAGFTDWAKAGDVPEFAQASPPNLPTDEMPTWRVKWWWYPIPFLTLAIGSQVGRKVMIWNAAQRRKARAQKKMARS